MSYHLLSYSLLFLPIALVLYQATPQSFRWMVILGLDYIFFYMLSGKLLIYLLGATLITYLFGMWISHADTHFKGSNKEKTKRKKWILALGVVLNLSMLVLLKYVNVYGGFDWAAPIGISYYTLQSISYMTDIHRGNIKPNKNLAKVALYMSFFPQIMEGPIAKFSETADDLYEGESLSFYNVKSGYQRILYGLVKKMLIADRLAPLVSKIFGNYENYAGSVILIAAICFTIQLYMEFSGCMDIVCGSSEMFGVILPDNFRQPFFAKNASEFWRRWHITLGRWLKDYIFYSVSLAKPVKSISKWSKKHLGKNVSKFVGPTIALFCVWLSNGIWHGPHQTYIFYGMFYFVIIFIENIMEAPMNKIISKTGYSKDKGIFGVISSVRILFIIVIGEMFFRAATISSGLSMFTKIFTNFNLRAVIESNYGIDILDAVIAFVFALGVLVVDILHEKKICVRHSIDTMKLPIRWGIWYAVILCLVIFGAYGIGYTVIDMIYAAY